MRLKAFILLLFLIASFSCKAQESQLWIDFINSKKENKTPILPDFSYVGYKYSEEEIPHVNYKIFNVQDFGAIPNDGKSDKAAFEKAIEAATKNNEGIVFFPKGKYHFFTEEDELSPIVVKTSHIVFRGEGQGSDGTILFFERNLEPKDPDKLWTTPKMILVTTSGKDKELTTVVKDAMRETFSITVADASEIKKEDWVILEVTNNSKELIEYDIAPLVAQPEWKSILNKGVEVNERHKVKSIQNNVITFYDPIHYDVQEKHNWKISRFAHSEEVGFENLTFEGNWQEEFVHHKSALHDGGWSILTISKSVNSWVKDCSFKNVNNALDFKSSASCTALNITVEGKIGHSAVHSAGSTGILLANINDIAGMHHSVGVGGGSNTATVIWHCKYPAHTSFESHASQPRCTLFDNVEGGFFPGRAGGARQNLPNHGRYLVLWNFKETGDSDENFRFWATDTWWWKIVPPIIVGFHGTSTTFKEDEVQIIESLGNPVKPESLFESQLQLRLGKLPEWIEKLKN